MQSALIATVKRGQQGDSDPIKCSIFLLRNDLDLIGRTLEHRRETTILGTFSVESIAVDVFSLRRLDGGEPIVSGDVFYAQLEEPKMEIVSTLVKGFVFSGKNWKLASPKKWKDGSVESPSSKPVGEVNLSGNLCDVFKLETGFVAIARATESAPVTE
jgi:hypothetical protein